MKVFSNVAILTLLLLIFTRVTIAASPGRAVHGVVRDSANKKVAGANVNVSCNGNILNATTNSLGFYNVQFNNTGDCKKDDLVTVSASKDSEAGSNSKNMNRVQININVKMSAVSVPEFDFSTGTLAVAASAGIFAYLKKKRHAVQ